MSTKNPNEVLSEQITAQLLEKNLIDKTSVKKITQAISQGTIRESEWKVFLEEVINKPKTSPNENK